MAMTTVGFQRKEEPVLSGGSERKSEEDKIYISYGGKGGFLNRKRGECKRKRGLKSVFLVTLYNQTSKGLTERWGNILGCEEDAKARKKVKATRREGC